MKKYDCLVLGGCSFGIKPFDHDNPRRNSFKQLEGDVKIAHTALDTKVSECDITKDVLRLKLEDALGTLHIEDEPVRMSPTMLSAQDISDLGIDSYKDEPVRKMSHEDT